MATAQEPTQAEQHWLEAKKIAHAMQKKLERIAKDESGSKKLLADLEAMEHMLETLRLACMATTFTDFKFAHKNRVLDRLWSLHSAINAEYKKGLQRHRSHNQFVQLRNVERQYAKHLKTAQYFYRGFIERLSARYQLHALQRIAHSLQADGSAPNLKVDEVIDAEQADLSVELTTACYRTILHMGDLSRYRMNAARQKSHGRHNPDMAMTYYALAQDLMPQEGDAHHQMAVVMAEQRKDFDVVYHFLRAWSVQHPFALAPANLASEFKKLLQAPSAGARKNGAAPPSLFDTFGSWTVRLHANYFRGEEFSSQGELESEVLHRWEALLKTAEQPQYLQKAVLMNFALYDIVSKKVADEWSETGSRSCQFALMFIVRSFLALSKVFEPEIDRLLEVAEAEEREQSTTPATTPTAAPAVSEGNGKQRKTNGKDGKDGKDSKDGKDGKDGKDAKDANDAKDAKKPNEGNRNNNRRNSNRRNGPVAEPKSSPPACCLALFRIYMAWLSLHHADVVKFQEHLQPYITDMHRSVTRCLSRCIALVADTPAASAPYLLPEDAEIIGLTPLQDWTTLRASQDGSSNTAYKPRFDEAGVERVDALHETLARVYDVVDMAVRLHGLNALPWVTAEQGGIPRIYFNQDYEPPAVASPPVAAVHASTGSVPAGMVPVATPTPPKNQEHGIRKFSPPAVRVQAPLAGSVPTADPWEYGGHSTSTADTTQPTTTTTAMAPPPLPVQTQQQQQQPWQTPVAAAPAKDYKEMDDMDDFLPGSMKEQPVVQRIGNMNISGTLAPDAGTDSELDQMGAETLKRIQTFLNPPEARQPHAHVHARAAAAENNNNSSNAAAAYLQQPTSTPSSYGMHTATAESVFGSLQTPSPAAVYYAPTSGTPMADGSATTAAAAAAAAAAGNPIPSSPWNRVYTPSSSSPSYYRNLQTPYGGMDPASGGGSSSNHLTAGAAASAAWQPSNIEEQLTFLTLAKQQQREFSAASAAAAAAAAAASASASAASPLAASATTPAARPSTASAAAAAIDPFGADPHGSLPLPSFRGFPSAFSPVGTAKVTTASPPGGSGGNGSNNNGFRNPWGSSPSGGSQGASASQMSSSSAALQRLLPQQLQQAQAASLGLLPSGVGMGAGESSPFGSSHFGMSSSMPSVQSPRGLPSGLSQQRSQDAAFGSSQQQQQQQQYLSPYAMQTGFSSGSLGDNNTTSYSSRAWDEAAAAAEAAEWGNVPVGVAAAAGGRNHDGPGRDESMLFRTAVRQTAFLEDTNAYDRNALLSALDDGGRGHAGGR